MEIIIVGCGRVGRSIAEQLNIEGHSITVIDEREDAFDKLSDTENIMAILGNVMKQSRGRADAGAVTAKLKELLA